jgi:hypothetical protein
VFAVHRTGSIIFFLYVIFFYSARVTQLKNGTNRSVSGTVNIFIKIGKLDVTNTRSTFFLAEKQRWQINYIIFLEPLISLPCLQYLTTVPYSELGESVLRPPTLFISIYFYTIPPPPPKHRSSLQVFPLIFLYAYPSCPLIWLPRCLINFATVLGEKENYKINNTFIDFVQVTLQKLAVGVQDVPQIKLA